MTVPAFSNTVGFRLSAATILLALAACSHLTSISKPQPEAKDARAQLSIGYSLLYQEASGIPKLNWLLKFKGKTSEMGQVTDNLVAYYQQLAGTMQGLSKQYPAMRINMTPMSPIEGETRKAIGTDQAKDFAPIVGKSGADFEREALLMFYDALNEQRHLVGAMQRLETNPSLQEFLVSTKTQLDKHYSEVELLLNRRYFTH